MTDSDRIAELERAVAFLARHLHLREVGHATPREYGRLQEIADWATREDAASPVSEPDRLPERP